MSKKVIKVESDAQRSVQEEGRGYFYSKHSREDIQEWLDSLEISYYSDDWEEVFFHNTWDDFEPIDSQLKDHQFFFDVEHSGTEINHTTDKLEPVECRHDEDIQKFIDEKPKRERENQINTLTRESGSLVNQFESLKSSVKENFESFKKLVDTDDYENLPEDEKKIYLNLKDLISSAENGILPVSL